MSRTLIITLVTIPLIVVRFVMGACGTTEYPFHVLALGHAGEGILRVRCTGGDITDLNDVPNKTAHHLIISNMPILNINNDTFSSFKKKVTVLECSYCEIETVQQDAFGNFSFLTVLRLSDNRLRSLNASWLKVLESSLRELELNDNQIEYIEDAAFDHLRNLTKLHIAHNKIKSLKFDMINRMEMLNFFDLSNNSDFNSFNDVFKFFRDHRDLNMHWSINNERCFAVKDSDGDILRYGCQPRNISDLSADPSKVKILSVTDVNIPLLTNETFSAFSSHLLDLTCLDCEIRNIQANAFSRFPNLKRLSLWFNKLKYINASSLQGLEGLTELNLSYNQISVIDDKTYEHLTNVEKLDLNNNQLECLNVTAMAVMKSLKHLDISYNPKFKCNFDVSKVLISQGTVIPI